jgi:hypothetical protein
MFSGIAWFRRRAGWARDGLMVTVGAVAVLGAFASTPLPAAAVQSATPGGSGVCGSAPTGPAGSPARITAGVGAFQSTPAGTSFQLRLAVTVTDAEEHPVPGAPVTFTAPARGPSGRFRTRTQNSKKSRPHISHPRRVTIATDACGVAVAPTFTADRQRGGYIVTAAVEHVRPAAFALVNAASGQRP